MQGERIIQKSELGVAGLSILEARELASSLGEEGRFVPKEDLPVGFQGELATAALVLLALSPAALASLVSWLLKRRVKKDIEVELVQQRPDGSTTTVRVKSRYSESSEPGKQALELAQQIGKHTGVSPDAILTALKETGAN